MTLRTLVVEQITQGLLKALLKRLKQQFILQVITI